MNIQLLLSANPSQAISTPGTQTTGTPGFPSGLFHQAMLQANEGHARALQSFTNGSAHVDHEPNALSEFTSLLDSLDIELDQEALASLLTQLQSTEQLTMEQWTALPDMRNGISETSSALDDITNRLALMATFSDSAIQADDNSTQASTFITRIAEQFDISESDASGLIAAYQRLNANIDTHAIQGRTETLNTPLAASIVNGNSAEPRSSVSSLYTATGFGITEAAPRSEILNQPATALLNSSPAAGASTEGQPRPLVTLSGPSLQQSSESTPSSKLPIPAAITHVRLSNEVMTSALAVGSSAADAAIQLKVGSEFALNMPSTSGAPQPQTVSVANAQLPSITTPISHPAWPSQLGQKLVQFAQRGGEQHIQMKLHPAEFGPLSISLKMTEHGAQAHFLSAHAQVRQVLEQAIPQLRDALAEQGISLGETSVGEQNASNEQAFAQQGNVGGGLIDGNDVESNGPTATFDNTPVTLDGRVDLYA